MRLTAKLSLILSLLSISVLAIAVSFLYVAERRHLLAQQLPEQRAGLEKLRKVCVESLLSDSEFIRLSYLKTVVLTAAPGTLSYVVFVDDAGKVLMHSEFIQGDFTRRYQPAVETEINAAMQAPDFLRQRILRGGRVIEALSLPVVVADKRVGTLGIGYDAAALEARIDTIQRESLLRYAQAIAIGVLFSLLCAVMLARTLARPIQALRKGAEDIGRGRRDVRVNEERGDELGDLARQFNTMARQLAELDDLKESFVAKITHDLRNPLSAIMGYIDAILLGMLGPVEAKQVKALKVAQGSGAYLAGLIDDILDVTKLEAGKMDFDPSPIKVRPVAIKAAELMQVKAVEFGLSLTVEVGEDVVVQVDEKALRRVLLNLISNAIKFTPAGGKVSVLAQRESAVWKIGVRDTGLGIPPDKLNALFKKFSQIAEHQNKAHPTKGTGLGLVICKEIVEAHGGRIWAESQKGEGSTFIFTFPAAQV